MNKEINSALIMLTGSWENMGASDEEIIKALTLRLKYYEDRAADKEQDDDDDGA